VSDTDLENDAMTDVFEKSPPDVELAPPRPGQLPLLLSPARSGVDLAAWCADHGGWLEAALPEAGAILFRGFGIDSARHFEALTSALFDERLSYTYRSTPRTAVGRNIYTTTEYPPPATIPQHNENAYQRDWPMKLVFCCLRPAATGGQTPLALTREVTRKIDPDVAGRFREKGVLYVRNYYDYLDLAWPTVFQTDDRQEMEAYCAAHGIEVEWKADGNLRTRQTAQAIAVHPVTRDELWFNQAHLFHVSSLDSATHAAMCSLFAAEDLPRTACYGDGSEIAAEDLAQIRTAFESETVAFDWQAGDVLLFDNMLVSHGRAPFEGEREVLAAMSEPFSSHERTEVMPPPD
jgi:alpha-ketoglutarate-dependent taurine dioxygenase